MKSRKVHLIDLHFDHQRWERELAFYKEEIQMFEKRLEDLIREYGDNKEMLAELEHFQNQFIRQKEVIDELRHKIHVHEDRLTAFAKAHPDSVDKEWFDDHTDMIDEMDTFIKIYLDLRREFTQFLRKWAAAEVG